MKILFLEDSVKDYELIFEQLTDAGVVFEAYHALNNKEFKKALSTTRLDIILSDYQLPDMNAFDALELRNNCCSEVPFICVSGSIGEELAIELLKKGADDYVLKDRMSRLPFAINRALEEVRERNARRAAQLMTQKSEEKFRNLFENHVAAKLLIDVDSGAILEANEAAARLVKLTVEELKRVDWRVLAQSTSMELSELIRSIQENGKTHFESRLIRKDGAIVDLEIFASKINVADESTVHAIIHDITDKKRTEEENMLLKKAVESSNISISITNLQGDLIYVNPFFLKVTGYSPEEVLGRNPRLLKSGCQPAEFYTHMWNTILSGHDWEGEFQNKKKNGELFWVKAVLSPITNRVGEITHFVAVKDDITEYRKLLCELTTAKNKAEESDRLKTAFLHNVSHEIRTLMNAIMGFGQFLADEDLNPQQRHEFFGILNQSAKRLMNTVDDMVEMATILSGVVKVDVGEVYLLGLLTELCFNFKNQFAEKKLSLKLSAATVDDQLFVLTDENILKRILEELLDNALKFTTEGFIEIGVKFEDQLLEIFVKDSGIGIDLAHQLMIFSPFNQVDASIARSYEGNGLGLGIVSGYAQILGVEIKINSEPGNGSTFSLQLPYFIKDVMPIN